MRVVREDHFVLVHHTVAGRTVRAEGQEELHTDLVEGPGEHCSHHVVEGLLARRGTRGSIVTTMLLRRVLLARRRAGRGAIATMLLRILLAGRRTGRSAVRLLLLIWRLSMGRILLAVALLLLRISVTHD